MRFTSPRGSAAGGVRLGAIWSGRSPAGGVPFGRDRFWGRSPDGAAPEPGSTDVVPSGDTVEAAVTPVPATGVLAVSAVQPAVQARQPRMPATAITSRTIRAPSLPGDGRFIDQYPADGKEGWPKGGNGGTAPPFPRHPLTALEQSLRHRRSPVSEGSPPHYRYSGLVGSRRSEVDGPADSPTSPLPLCNIYFTFCNVSLTVPGIVRDRWSDSHPFMAWLGD